MMDDVNVKNVTRSTLRDPPELFFFDCILSIGKYIYLAN